jgi:serine/threonine protein kinase
MSNSRICQKKAVYSSLTSLHTLEKYAHEDESNKKTATPSQVKYPHSTIDPEFEYQGYHKFGRILGRGGFGTVIECQRKSDNKPIAIKFFKYKAIHKLVPLKMVADYIDDDLASSSEFFSKKDLNYMLPSEVACLIRARRIDGVIRILDYIPETESNKESTSLIDNEEIIGIVLERNFDEICLFEYLKQNGRLSESEARVIMKQILHTNLDLLHSGIFHGDVKSENILIDTKTKKIKLIDFGSAQIIDSNLNANTSTTNQLQRSLHKCNSQSIMTKAVRTFRGTNLYKPPEFLLNHFFYPRPSTVWTFGIILYDMVCGHFPFDNDSDVLVHQDKEILFTKTNLSDEFKDLVRKCLAFFVADRIVIEKILLHPWMTKDN